MPDDEIFPSKDKNTAKAKRTPRRWSVIVIEILLVLAAGIVVFRLLTNGQSGPSLDAAKQYEWGMIYQKNGEHAKAVESLTAAIDQGYTPLGLAYYDRATSYYALGRYDDAIADYTQSIALTPDCDDCYIDYRWRGNAQWMEGNDDAARQDYTQSITINPRYFAAYVSRAELSASQGDRAQALADVKLGMEKSAGEIVERGLANGQERSVDFDSEAQQYHFTFSANVGDDVTLTIARSTLDVVILLQDAEGKPLAYDDSQGSRGGDSLNYLIEETGDYTLLIAAYDTAALGEITLTMLSVNADEDSVVPDAPRITPETVSDLAVADNITNQATLQRDIASNGTLVIEKTDRQLIIYDLRDEPIGYNSIEIEQELMWGVAISSDGKIAAAGVDNTLTLYNAITGSVLRTLNLGEAYPSAMAFSPDSATIAVVIYNEVKIYDAISGSLLYTFEMDHIYGKSLAFSRDGTLLAVGQDKGLVHIWDIQDERLIRTLKTGKVEEVLAIAFSPNADLIAVGGEARRVQVWDLSTGGLREQFAFHERKITDLAFSPDGQLLASASDDGAAHVWSMIEDRTTPVKTLSHEGPVEAIAFQADGRTLVTAADDNKIRFWRVKE